jgi:hypothetical protein
MRPFRWIRRSLLLALVAFCGILLYGHARSHPEDVPWTGLDLARPIGLFTGTKVAALGRRGARCMTLLGHAGVRFTQLPARHDGEECGYDDAVRLIPAGALPLAFRPGDLGVSCPVAAGLALWDWHVVQPAALARFGQRVASVEHFGSYSCRRIYGRPSGAWSEHSGANAIDVAGFVLEDGTRISVAWDWHGKSAKARFLHDVRDGGCRVFSTILSPDYNAAHRDHLHLDEAKRGAMGWRACR